MISKKEFMAYKKVRNSGTTNMFALTTVCELSGLERPQVMEIMKNYSALNEKFDK